MKLPNELVSQFAKLSKNQNEPSEKTVYGTTVMQGDKLYVNIDGSDTITPVVTMSDIKPGERVTVLIKDHSATILGNITNPSAGTEEMGKVLDEYDTIIAKIGNFELIVADKVTTEQLDAKLAIIDEALIGKATIAELEAVKATIKDLDVSNLYAEIARIDEAIIKKATIEDLNAAYAEIGILKGDVADIETLIGGNLTMDNIQSLILTSSKVTVDNAFIKDAMIDRVSASKLTAGVINTDLISIESEDGSLNINSSLQQFKDSEGNVRIQIGKDANGDFTFVLYGPDGQGQLINQNGITSSAIEDGLIVNDMVAEDAAISGSKLDIDSVIEEVNGSTTTIKSSRIFFDEENQSLDVALNNLISVTEETQSMTTSNTTSINAMQGSISTLISNTTIETENGETVLLKDEFSSFRQTVDGFDGKISSLETSNENVQSKITEFQANIDGISTRVSNTEKMVDGIGVGGKNLLNGTTSWNKNATWTTYLTADISGYISLADLDIKPGDALTISCYVNDVPVNTRLMIYFYGATNGAYKTALGQEIVLAGESGRLVSTVTVPELCETGSAAPQATERICIYLYRPTNTPANVDVQYAKLQLERGSVVTDWSPSVQDTMTELTNMHTEFTQTFDSISASVNQNGREISSIKLTLDGIDMNGYVTFSNLSQDNGTTNINGGNIRSGFISCNRLNGGTISAADEINFIGGARIFGNEGETGAGLTVSAGGITLGGGSVNFLNGSWYVQELNVSGDTICDSISGSYLDITNTISGKRLEISGDIVGGNNIYAKGNYLVYHTGNKPTASDVGALSNTGGTISGALTTTGTTKANRLEANGDVVCNSVWARSKVYANNVALTSDVKLKTDIKYVNVDTQTMGETGLLSPNVNITTSDMLEFIETLPMTSYRMTSEIDSNQDYTYYGFIAQDILYTKVGSELIEYGEKVVREEDIDEDGNPIINYKTEECLRYSENKFVAFICGALQEEIRQRKALEREITLLKEIVKKESE